MNNTLLKNQYNLQELTEAEALSIDGGVDDGNGTLADEIGYAVGKAARWVKDIGDDDEWFG